MIVVGRWTPNRIVVGLNGHFGALPAQFGVGGDFPSPWLNDVDPGDEATEFAGVVQSLPGSGTVTLSDIGEFQHTGAANGTYITTDTRLTWPPGGPITVHTPDEEIETNFGSGGGVDGTASGRVLAAAAALIAGTASGPASATAAGVTLTAGAALLPGTTNDGTTPVYATQPTTSASWSYRQTATLWSLTGRDAWGGQVTHAAPVLFLCDYAEDNRRMTSARGDEFTSRLLIYTSLPGVKQGDMVLIGASTERNPYAAGAQEVRAITTWADTFKAEGYPDFRIAT
jgi:hypothetical protein